MPKAILTIDDTPDGEMALSLFLEGGFQVDSNAHQCANLLIKNLDQMGAVTEASEVRELTGDEAEQVIADATALSAVAHASKEVVQGAKRPVLTLIQP